jgi:hypothetical protein
MSFHFTSTNWQKVLVVDVARQTTDVKQLAVVSNLTHWRRLLMKKITLASFLAFGVMFAQTPGATSSSETTVTRQTHDGKKVKTRTDSTRTDSNTDQTGATTSTTTSRTDETEAKKKGKHDKVKSKGSSSTTTTTTTPPPSNP